MRYHKMFLCGASALAFGAALTPAHAQTTPAQSGPVVEEIVVTAQKRQENVNNIGMSVAAATGAQLQALGVSDTSQLVKLVPGFNFTPNYTGTAVYTIRGVGFQDTSLAASPTVSVYSDEVPMPFSIMTQGANLDLQRVEVLKGPQGTLFGENATGGAVNYITNKPTDNFQAGVDATYARFNTVDVSGYVGGPITDTLDFRVAARSLQSGPWQKSYTQPGQEWGRSDFVNARAALLWRPTDNFKALLTIQGWQDHGDSQMPQLFGIRPLNPVNGVLPSIANYPLAPKDPRAADWNSCINNSPFNPPFNSTLGPVLFNGNVARPTQSTSCSPARKHNDFFSGSLRLDYDLGGDITLTSLTAYEDLNRTQALDGDGMNLQDWESIQGGHINTVYQEVRVSGKFAGKGSWIAGGNYETDNSYDNFLQSYGDSSAVPIGPIYLGPARPVNIQNRSSWAVFGDVDYPVLSNVSVHAGVRYTDNDDKFHGCAQDAGDGSWSNVSALIQGAFLGSTSPVNPGPGACATTGPAPTFNPAPQFFTSDLHEHNISWRAGVDYHPIQDTLLYFNVSQGWKAGSFPTVATSSYQQLFPVKQEGLLSYEGGFKSRLLDGSMQLNGAVFYYDYKDKQILGALADPVFGALPALVNVPKSHVIGFELVDVWEPIEGLTIAPSVSYAKSKVDGDYVNFDAFSNPTNFKGMPFPDAPKWQGDVDVQYKWAVRDNVKAFVGANLNYQDATQSFFVNPADPDSHTLDLPAYMLLDLRAGIETGAWRFQVWGRNVTNKYYWTNALHVNDAFVRYAGMPATYGVTVSWHY